MKYSIFTLAALALAFPMVASALTLQEAQSMAMDNYPLIKDYALIALTEDFTVDNASKAWLPQVTIGAQSTWQSSVASYPEVLTEMLEQRGVEIKGLGRFQYKAPIDVRQTIWDGGRIKASQDVARAEAHEQAIADDVEMYQLRQRIHQIFFSILLLQQQEQALSDALDLLDANYAKVQTLLRNGAAMQCDADAVEVEILSTRQQLASVESTLESYRTALALYTGCKKDVDLDMPVNVVVPNDNSYFNRPEYRLLHARITTLNARESEINRSVMPTIGAFAQGYFGYPGMNFMQAMMNRNPGFNAMVGVNLSWNIGALYTKGNKLKILAAQRERIDVAKATFQFNNDLQSTRQRQEIKRLERISQDDQRIVELRQRVRRASEAQLREGIIDPTELLLRITQEKNAIISANSHKIEYLMAVYQLRNTLNYR